MMKSKCRRLEGALLPSIAVALLIRLIWSNLGVCKVELEYDDAVNRLSEIEANPQDNGNITRELDRDSDCPFRDSPIYRKVFVYPNFGAVDDGWGGSILSPAAHNGTVAPWPWLKAFDQRNWGDAFGEFWESVQTWERQYYSEVIIMEIMLNPRSCLRTMDPEEAVLFFVPYPLVAMAGFGSTKFKGTTEVYAQALADIVDEASYEGWENHFGLTSRYWKRRGGADHILVQGSMWHGLPTKEKIHEESTQRYSVNQRQLAAPITVVTEITDWFAETYPKCTAKNILIPDPETNGLIYSGFYDWKVSAIIASKKEELLAANAAHPAEKLLSNGTDLSLRRPIANYYLSKIHGVCKVLRSSLMQDYKACSRSYVALRDIFFGGIYRQNQDTFSTGPRASTFCTCAVGDSPAAKRNYDAVRAGCIPVILGTDFIWPLTSKVDPSLKMDPADFSLRFPVEMHWTPTLNDVTCEPLLEKGMSLEARLMDIPADEIRRLRSGVAKMRDMYSWYAWRNDPEFPREPLVERVLPDGGLAHAFVQALADRASGVRWPSCEQEVENVGAKMDFWKC